MRQLNLAGKTKVEISIKRIKFFEPPDGYWLAFSGGKDSCVIKKLADIAGVKYEAHYNFTTVDYPVLVKFIKEVHPDVIIDRPPKSMFQLIPEKLMPPTRLVRYCCEKLKEQGGIGRIVMTGIRSEESTRRKNYQVYMSFKKKILFSPILDWYSDDIWEFIHSEKIPYCSLYDEGYKRLGCIMCPMAPKKQRLKEKDLYPKFYKAYLLAFKKMLERRIQRELKTTWQSPEEVMKWWLSK